MTTDVVILIAALVALIAVFAVLSGVVRLLTMVSPRFREWVERETERPVGKGF